MSDAMIGLFFEFHQELELNSPSTSSAGTARHKRRDHPVRFMLQRCYSRHIGSACAVVPGAPL